jgi:hypothetical protein
MHEFIARRGDDLFPGRSKLRPTALWLAAHTDGGDYVFQRAAHGVYSVACRVVVVSLLALVAASAASNNMLHGADNPISVGDEAVTIGPAPLKVGGQELLTVPGGSRLVAKAIREGWIGVEVEHDGRTVKGWVSARHVTVRPATMFLKLTIGYESEIDRADEDFRRVDKNADGQLDPDEFVVGTRKETLEDLNHTLRQVWGRGASTQADIFILHNRLVAAIGNHRYWQRQMTFDDGSQLAEDFRTTRDIRQSNLARKLVDTEPAAATSVKARAMFVWADSDRDNGLSLQEFRRALRANRESVDTTKR